jgi:hypothetical protein
MIICHNMSAPRQSAPPATAAAAQCWDYQNTDRVRLVVSSVNISASIIGAATHTPPTCYCTPAGSRAAHLLYVHKGQHVASGRRCHPEELRAVQRTCLRRLQCTSPRQQRLHTIHGCRRQAGLPHTGPVPWRQNRRCWLSSKEHGALPLRVPDSRACDPLPSTGCAKGPCQPFGQHVCTFGIQQRRCAKGPPCQPLFTQSAPQTPSRPYVTLRAARYATRNTQRRFRTTAGPPSFLHSKKLHAHAPRGPGTSIASPNMLLRPYNCFIRQSPRHRPSLSQRPLFKCQVISQHAISPARGGRAQQLLRCKAGYMV